MPCSQKNINLCADIDLRSVIVEHTINPYLCKYKGLYLDVLALSDRLITGVAYAKKRNIGKITQIILGNIIFQEKNTRV